MIRVLMPRLGSMSVRHVTPVTRSTDPYLQRILQVMAEDLAPGAPPFIVHAAHPQVLAGLWLTAREAWLAGPADRAAREAVAAGVSAANECPFCVEVHTTTLRAGGHSEAARAALGAAGDQPEGMACYVAWGRATLHPSSPTLARPPFPESERAQMIGTAFLFHYLNRIVNVLVEDSPFPAPVRRLGKATQKMGDLTIGTQFARTVVEPGRYADLLPPTTLPPELAWAGGRPPLAAALARFAAAVDNAATATVPGAVRELLLQKVSTWNGEPAPLSRAWVQEDIRVLPEPLRAAATLALVVALAPHQSDDTLVAAFRAHDSSDAALVGLLAYAAFTAARRITTWL